MPKKPRLEGYRMTEKLYDGTRTLIYRAKRKTDNQSVIVKFLKNEYPSFEELLQFRNQYTIAKNLDLDGIVHPLALENYHNGFALVLEDTQADSLHHYIKDNPLTLTAFFHIAIAIVKVLEELYQNQVIHKDIKPHNIVIHPKTRQIKLIDFSIASRLPRETHDIQSPNVLEGTLAYLSPEQTGRMNRGIDYRTDFYSLGITFYELLTGQLPFQSDDPMELVHCHIAQVPTPPMQVNATIPKMVNDIILKLMAKTAEDRYQSAFGIRYDLELCQLQWESQNQIMPFTLAQRDISDQFQIPEKLYGREAELATLLATFDRVSEGNTEMMLVAGFSGIGKTALINEVHKPIVRQRGYFIKGKFDQFKRNIPFSALVQAFQTLMRQLLTETAAQVAFWKTKILAALGENAQVIIEVIPELEQIIGQQQPVPELEGSAAQNRFNRLFQKFINVFATAEHPLVIFVDDLQWIDSASLKLMQLLMTETDSHYLLLMGAYRDNEVSVAHPLILTLEEIQKTDALVNQIILGPLAQPDLNRLIADTLSCPFEKAIPLTELVIQKTQGNPFFTNQFLKYLHEEQLIAFDFDCNYWQSDIAKVKQLAVSDNVVEFMALQLQKLPTKTQNVLKLAACIGNQFDLATLAIVYENSQADTATVLWNALQEGLIIPISDVYKFFQSTESREASEVQALSVPYKFLHDRVQQAAYSLIPEAQKVTTHLKIGQLLKNYTSEDELDEKIFDIINQMNQGIELLSAQTERDELAQLNLQAGRKARASTAYIAANQYLTTGIELLKTDCWQTQYDLTLALYESAAEAAYLNGDFSRQKQLVETVLTHAQTLLDKVKAFEIKMNSCLAQNQWLEAVKIALSVLKLFGITFPDEPSSEDVQLALEKTRFLLADKSVEDLINLPEMTDPNQLAVMRLLSNTWTPVILAIPKLGHLMAFLQVNLSLQYGNTATSAMGYTNYGIVLCQLVGDFDTGFRFGELAVRLLERFHAKEIKPQVLVYVHLSIWHWKKHLKESLKPFLEAYQSALETGNLAVASYGASDYTTYLYFSGKELDLLEPEMTRMSSAIKQLNQEFVFYLHEMMRQAVLNLKTNTNNSMSSAPNCLIGKVFNEKNMLPRYQQTNDRFSIFFVYFNKLILCYLFQNYQVGFEQATLAQPYLDVTEGAFFEPWFAFYDSLVRLAVYPNAPLSEQPGILEQVSANQNKMQRWGENAPMNYQHKFELVEAERHRVLGKNVEAMDFYERAITGAKKNEYLNEEALANELAAIFYINWGKAKFARMYMTEAYYCYARWGAKAKVDDLEKRYPELLASILNEQYLTIDKTQNITSTTQTLAHSTSTSQSEVLDFATVFKASQAISGEIRLEKLLSTLMRVVNENAGAEKSVLILQQEEQLIVNAFYKHKKVILKPEEDGFYEAIVMQAQPIEESSEIPLSLINYVSRTHETQVIDDGSQDFTFAGDPYFIKHQPRSVLCLPVLHHGRLLGLLYLENNLTTKAFTAERLKVLKVLSSQAAISLENALLYRTLEQKVAKRTSQLAKANKKLAKANDKLAKANEEITELNEQLRSENLRMGAELDVSRQLQQMLLPKARELKQITGLDIAGFMEPADEVGGDYYDVLQHNGHIKVGIGDVTGHGLESGVLMLMVQMAVQTLLTHEVSDPKTFLTVLNQAIYHNVKRIETDKNLTLSLLDYQDGKLQLTGQHEEVLVVRQNGQVERIDTLELGFMVGVVENIANFVSHREIELQPGEGIVLYTDGITEARNTKGELYGLERLCEVVSQNWAYSASEIQQAVIAKVRQHIGKQKILDDITLLILKQK